MARSRVVTVWLPVVAWAAVIFAFSSVPHLGTGLGTWDTVVRKGAHIADYAVFGALLYRALGREALALAAGIAYAATDELHQHFVRGRHASPVYFRRDAEVTEALRRLQAAGTRIGVFTDAPEELARVALSHLGANGRVELLEAGSGARERLIERLGTDTVVVGSHTE